MRGEDQHAGVAHRDEHHQDVVGRVLGRELFAALSKLSRELVAEVAGGFVAVVAVGDVDGPVAHGADDVR